jgi:hypothetical protein
MEKVEARAVLDALAHKTRLNIHRRLVAGVC